MNFKEAVLSGKKVRSQYWNKNQHLDTSIFEETLDDFTIGLISDMTTPLTWKEIFGKWEFYE